jgi:hypothetical protein
VCTGTAFDLALQIREREDEKCWRREDLKEEDDLNTKFHTKHHYLSHFVFVEKLLLNG